MRYIFLIIILFTTYTFTAEPPTNKTCVVPVTEDQFEILKNIPELLKKPLPCNGDTPNGKIISWAKDQFGRYDDRGCDKFFVDKNGNLGELSKLIVTQISADMVAEKDNSAFLQDYPDIIALCPGYTTMQPTSRLAFWAWFFEILAFFETSCRPELANNAADVPDGTALGLYQMESTISKLKSRGPNCKKIMIAYEKELTDYKAKCKAPCPDLKKPTHPMLKPKENTICAIDTLKGILTNRKAILGARDPKTEALTSSYWQVLNPPTKAQKAKSEANMKKHAKEVAWKYETKYSRFSRYLPYFPLCELPKPPATEPPAIAPAN